MDGFHPKSKGDDLRLLKPCGHTFHFKCIKEDNYWVDNSTCPICKNDVKGESVPITYGNLKSILRRQRSSSSSVRSQSGSDTMSIEAGFGMQAINIANGAGKKEEMAAGKNGPGQYTLEKRGSSKSQGVYTISNMRKSEIQQGIFRSISQIGLGEHNDTTGVNTGTIITSM